MKKFISILFVYFIYLTFSSCVFGAEKLSLDEIEKRLTTSCLNDFCYTGSISPISFQEILENKLEKVFKKWLCDLRKDGLLFKRKEFDKNLDKLHARTNCLDRILGAQFLERAFKDLGITHIKTPKMFVVMENEKLPVIIRTSPFGMPEIYASSNPSVHNYSSCQDCDNKVNATIYAQKIVPCERPMSFIELEELFKVIYYTRFANIGYDNFIITHDSVYIVDTATEESFPTTYFFKKTEMGKIFRYLQKGQDEDHIKDLFEKLHELIKKYDIFDNKKDEDLSHLFPTLESAYKFNEDYLKLPLIAPHFEWSPDDCNDDQCG